MKTYMGLCVSKAIVANNHVCPLTSGETLAIIIFTFDWPYCTQFLMDKIKISRQTFIRLTQCLELYVTQLPPTSA